MSNPKFTPGPWMFYLCGIDKYKGWTIGKDNYRNRKYVKEDDVLSINEIASHLTKPNARLISAAPEMYEQLKSIQNLAVTFDAERKAKLDM